MQAERLGRLPLAARDGLDAAAPDLAEEGAGVEHQRHAGGDPRVDVEAEHRRAEEDQEQLQQQRRALEDLDEQRRGALQQRHVGGARERDGQPADRAADEGDQRQRQRPLRRIEDEQQFRPAEGAHRFASAPVGVVEPRAVDGAEQRRERDRQQQVDGGDDDVDLEAAEGLRLQVRGDRGQVVGRDHRDDARAEHQQDELAGQRRIDRLQRGFQDDEAEDLVRLQVRARGRPRSAPCGMDSMPARMISVA